MVRELKEGDEGYDEYVAAAAEKLGEPLDSLAFARPFDITLKNPQTDKEYQPTKNVQVSIRLLNKELNEYTDVDVIHFPGEADGESEILNASINGDSVKFKTDGFSVYVLTGVQDTLRTYYFYSYNEYGDYASFFFYTDQNTMTDHLTIKNGEKLFAPHDPTHPTDPRAVFIGWFEGTATDNNTIEFSEKPFDFSKEQNIDKEDGNTALTVHLYAMFSNVARVNFHGQYDADTGSYPIVETFMGTLEEGQTSISVPVDNYKAGYYSTVDGAFPKYKFYGWSADPIEVPGEGQTYKVSSPMDVVGAIDLYPIYDEIRWLSYNSGNAGTGATYFAPVSFPSGDGLAEEDIKIPTRQGYTFTGWYLSVESQGIDAQNGTGLQLTDSVGKFADHAPSELSPYGISITTDQETGKKRLYLSGNREIYAGWDIGTADYKIVVWKARNVNSGNYDWAESFTLRAQPGDVVPVVTPQGEAVTTGTLAPYEALNDKVQYNNVHAEHRLGEDDPNPYADYVFDGAKTLNDTTYDRDAGAYTGTKTVAYDNTTVVNLYYERTTPATPEAGDRTLTFHFNNTEDGTDETSTKAVGASLEDVVPPTASQSKPGYEFVWYADESCTARVFFDQESFGSYTDGAKVLYTTMPDHDLTVYGNWEKRWYLIQIDPNYGALYAYNDAEPPVLTGNGSTYFFKSYQGDYIQEYTWVTRDYVASESGDFYYVNHDYDYVRKNGGDRYTYYTKNLEEATEYTTYKYKEGAYLYDGWYQVNEDGTETPYTFGELITDNIKLRLHWKLAGIYYLDYNADVTMDGKRLIGSVGGGATLSDPNPYRDQAGVTIEQTAEAPEGYTFVGWRVRGDNTGTIYYPGSDFALPAEHAVTMGGKERVFLDAVYGRVATATVIYDANGGSITDAADAGYPYSVNNNHPVLNEEGKPVRLSHKVERDVTGGTVTVSGVVNNSPVLLSSGVGFTAADTMTGAVLTGWNTQPDGSGTHFDLGDEALLTPTSEAKIYLDTAEPVTLYAEWKITVTFTKNSNDATWNEAVWNGYVSDLARLTQNDAGDYMFTTYVGAKLKEPPEGVLTRPGQTFDFWSKKADGDETGAFDFATETLSGSKTLYAHWTQATLVPFHISDGTAERADWQKTPKLRVNDDGTGLALNEATLANYTQAPEGYAFRYACLSDNGAGVSENQKITAVSIGGGAVCVTKQGAAEPEPLGERKIWLVYLPVTPLNDANVKIVYVKEDNTGNLTQLGSIQYNGAAITLNGQPVAQNQTLTVDSPKIISQTDENGFRLPPLLDDGEAKLSRVCYKIGVGNENTSTVSGLGGVSESLELYLRTRDNKLQWSFDDKTWTDFTAQTPTVYAIYRERGYELTLKKSVIGDDTGISPDETFRVTIASNSITRDSYSVEGTGYTSVEASPASASAPGTIDLSVKDGSEIKIIGLASGSYTITETRNDGYEVAAKLNGTACDVSDPWTLSQDTTYELSNTPQILCRIQNPQTMRFYTLNRALEYAESEMNGTATIELLRDYTIPSWDAMEIPAGFNIELKSKGDDIFTITRDEEFLSAPMISSSGTLTLDNITLDGNSVQVGCPMVQSMGTLTLNAKTTLRNAKSDSNGGAIEIKSGTLTMANDVTISGNSAASGGAVYVNSGAVTVTGGSMSGNSAASGGAVFLKDGSLTVGSGAFEGNTASVNGGAIYAANGTVTVNGGTFGGASEAAGNTANGSGGAIYAHGAVVTLTSGTVQNNKAASGGAIYMQVGQLAISGGSMTKNSATSGNGGAVYMDSGNMSLSGGSMTKNSATNGSGGAVYVDAGTINHSAGTIGGTVGDDGNTAVNGAGVFVNRGTANFSGTAKITYNTATAGGAVGVGTEAAKLNFAGTVQIKENTLNNKASNVYLNLDSGDILNFAPLASGAYVGVHVPGEFDSELFENRGTVCARFADYTDNQNANADFKSYVKNDRLNQMGVSKDTATNKLYWYKSFTVQALKLGNNVLPNGTNGENLKEKIWYTPPASDNRASVIAEDFRVTASVDVGTRVFAGAYIREAAGSFDDYVTRIYWDNGEQEWKAVKRDGTEISIPNESGSGSLMLYYADAAYLSIENNSDYKFTIDPLEVKIGGDTLQDVVEIGYGYVVAQNGATRESLEPITQDDLTLDAHGAIKFLFPGAVKRGFELTGKFTNTDGTPILWNGQITYTLTGVTGDQLYPETLPDPIPTDPSYQPDPLDINKTLLDAGKTYEIIFGGKKVICKIVNDSEISGLTQGTDYVEKGTRSDGNVEYRFDTLNQAVSFAKNHKPTATIELLTDYLIPTADNVYITDADCNLTFTTALISDGEAGVTGMKVYPTTAAKPYATISRDAGNTDSLIRYEVTSGQDGELTVTKLNFDGKNLGGTNKFGAIKTNNIGVNISHSVFLNFKAQQGGAVSVDYIETYSGDYGLTVDDCIFKNCESQGGNRVGGGAIWTCAKVFTLTNSYFESCKAADQGGAVFHRIDALKNGNGKSRVFTYAKDTQTYVENCQFINCEAGAAGGLEMDTYYVEVTDCTFRNCRGKTRNAGAVNIYIYEGSPAEDPNITDLSTESGTTEAHFVGCTFENCSAGNRGGGIRTLLQVNTVKDCTFKNCYTTGSHNAANEDTGGAICLANKYAQSLTVSGCTIDGCYTTANNKAGGGIYCSADVLTIGDYDYTENNRTDKIPTDKSIGIFVTDASGHTIRRTKIANCTTKGEGGGVAHVKDNAELRITNATISDNKTGKTGGGVSTKAKNVTITGSTIEKNTATGNGGGVYVLPSTKTGALTLDGCAIRENVTDGKGGGVYTEIALTLMGNSMITANVLNSETKENAAGVYQPKDKGLTLTVGKAGAETDSSSIKGNGTASGAPSNLVLSEASGQNTANSVKVLCNLSGEIYVINAKKKGTKFGVAVGAKYLGFKDSGLTELEHTFIADNNTLFGVFDRMDEDGDDGWDIVWRGDVVCKLTDEHGRLLYLNEDCSEPAIFDRLDYATDGSRVSPFSYLRAEDPKLWYYDASNQKKPFTVAGNTCCVKLLVSSYDLSTQIKTGAYPDRTIILTTAGRTDSLYPFTGTGTGSRATINRGSAMKNAMINDTGVNLKLRNIVLDGKEVSVGNDGALIYAKNSNTAVDYTITLAESAMLQNGKTSKNGGGVYVENCSLDIAGGTIYNCSAAKGGGVRKVSAGTLTFSSGLITRCTATGNDGGGGIAYQRGSGTGFTMSGSAQITRCSANNGGGVYIDNNSGNTMNMTGGSITQNTANNGGGGIYPAGTNVKLNFSGRVTVSGNKLQDGTVNNVELHNNNNGIINSQGIERGSYIGVYVSGTYIPLTEEQRRNGIKHDPSDTPEYSRHGGEGDRFGTYMNGSDTRFLYFFVNDRNGLKGGLKSDDGIYWTTIFSLEVGKRVTSTDPNDLNEAFSFTVTLSGVAEHNAAILGSTIEEDSEEWESDGSVVKIQDGTATFSLKNGQSRRWNNLPAGITYKVTENLDDARKAHYTTLPAYEITGTIGENLYKDDVGSKYLSTAVFTNLNAVCKLTLDIDGDGSSDALLYEYDANDDLVPAVYSSLQEAFDKINSGAPFKFLNKYVSSTTWQDYTAGSDSYLTRIEMLIDSYDLKAPYTIHTLNSGKQALLTTAEKGAEDGYPYAGNAGTVCEIKRGFGGNTMFSLNGTLTLTDITLDGNKDSYTCDADGGIAAVNQTGTLNIWDGAALQNCTTSGNGGAVLVNGGTLSVEGGRITGNTSKNYGGGAIRVQNNGTVTVSGTAEISGNSVKKADANGGAISVKQGTVYITGGMITDNTVTNKNINNPKKAIGGAVYIEKGNLYLSGGTITGNTVDGTNCNGAGIYIGADAKMYLSGNPDFGGPNITQGNRMTPSLAAGAKNGGEDYTCARQDIYLAGYAGPDGDTSAASLIVDGDISSGDGTIWVWAAESPHYKTLQQFAKYDNAGVTDPETTLKAFRNARVDADTGADSVGQYLYGVTKADDTAHNVFWYGVEGSRRVILRKVSGPTDGTTASSLAGASFTVCRQGEKAPYVVKEIKIDGVVHKLPEDAWISLSGLTSRANGVFWVGELPFGKYYIIENDTYYFELIVGDKKDDGTPLPDGCYIGTRQTGNPLA